MKTKLSLILIHSLLLINHLFSQDNIPLNLRCLRTDQITPILKQLRHQKWEQIDSSAIKKLWPRGLTSRDCESIPSSYKRSEPETCKDLSEGYCAEDVCYCSIVFMFRSENTKEGLDSLILMYSSESYDELTHSAEKFVDALSPLKENSVAESLGNWKLNQNKMLSKTFDYELFEPYWDAKRTFHAKLRFPVQIDLLQLDNGIWWMRLVVDKPY